MQRFGGFKRSRYQFVSSIAACLCLLGLVFGASSAAAATTLNVNTTADTSASGGACGNTGIKSAPNPLSLREAVCLGNNIGGEVTINIPSGTYKLENGELTAAIASGQVERFVGAGSALTIIDGQNSSRVFNLDPNFAGGTFATFVGMTIQGGRASQFGGGGILDGNGSTDSLTIEGCAFNKNVSGIGANAYSEIGAAVGMEGGTLVIKSSTFTENNSNSAPGSAVGFYNSVGPESQHMTITGSTFTGNRVVVTTNNGETARRGGAVYVGTIKGSSEISDSAFRENQATTSTGDGAAGGAISMLYGVLTVLRSSFIGNSVSSSGTGVAVGAAIALPNQSATPSDYELTLKYNRIVGNTPAATAVYLVEASPAFNAVKAAENWWGCNAGPGGSGCDGKTGTVTTEPRLVFRAGSSPAVAGPDGSATISGNFFTDSANGAVAPSELTAFNGAEATWSNPTPAGATVNGKAAPQTSKTAFSAGKVSGSYVPNTTTAGTGGAKVVFDNQEATPSVTIDEKPVVTGNPSSQMVLPGATATFTASATGTPTPTAQWQRNTGSGFTNIAGATSTTYSFTTVAGETGYQFRAVFTNTIEGAPYPVPSNAATLTVGKATTTISTTASNAVIGGSIHDTATLSGGNSPSGTITFKVFAPGDTTCVTALDTTTKRITENGSIESSGFIPSQVGEYRWTAVYSGDANNEEAVGACNAVNEKSTVSKATPSLSTNATNATIGGTIHDSATFINGVTPGGTLTFNAYAPGDTTCSAPTPAFTATVNVTENGSYESGPFTPATAGEYRWTATYSGDAKNNAVNGACSAVNETSNVIKAVPTISTTASQSNTGGAAIFDTATLAGGHNPGGTIVFRLFGPTDTTCTGKVVVPTTDNVTQNGTYQSGAYGPPLVAGDYRWTVEYSGDANNAAVTEPCNAPNETSTVGKATTALSTNASDGIVGGSIHDAATLSGGGGPGGTITFEAYAPGDTTCSATTPAFTSSPISVNKNGSYESGAFTPGNVGEYRWTASYSGDANNNGSSSGCNAVNEISNVGQASPTLSTQATGATAGGKIHDTATLAAGQGAGGTITFTAYGPDDATCGHTAAFSQPVTVNGNGEYDSPDFEPSEAGEYRWTAGYSGDSNNKSASSGCNAPNELSTVIKASPTISTNATDAAIGGKIHDTATIAAGQAPVGMITFEAFGPGNSECTGGPAFKRFVAVNGNGEYDSPDFEAATAGEYRWTAVYSGDGNNNGASSACNAPNELSTVAQAAPTISTVATGASLGNPVHDTATIAAGFNPGGTVTFKVFAPGDTSCTTPIETLTATVSGNGSYGSGDFTPATIGDYRWTASYSGDVNNKAATGSCNDSEETSTITKAVTALSTSSTNAAIGSAIHDSATLSGGQAETGTITFKVYGPDDATCTGPVAETLTATVNGNGTYGSGAFTPAQSGTYRWVATYSGDTENEGKAGTCGDSGETSTVANAMPTISTEATDATIGGEIEDTATIAAGQNPGGTVTFEAFGPGDELCAKTAVFTKKVPVSGNGKYASTGLTPEPAGAYQWVAKYSGDGNNTPAAGRCGDADETSTVAKVTPKVSSSATDATLGDPIHDTAALTDGHNPGGTITLAAYGPNDTACTGPVAFTKTLPVAGDGSYASGDFTPTAAGTYRWVVSYSGDADNQATTAACGATGETSTVTAPPPATNPTGDNPPAKPIVPCLPSAPPSAGGYVPKTTVKTGTVLGVRARIHVGMPSNLEVATTLKYRLNGKTLSVDLGSSSLEDPGTRNLRVAIPASLREVLPLGTKVRLALTVSAVPAGSNPCSAEAKQSKLSFKTKVVKVLLPR